MNHFLLLTALFAAHSSWAACLYDSKKAATAYYKEIVELSSQRDISLEITLFLDGLKECGFSKKSLGIKSSDVTRIIASGKQAELQLQKKEINEAAPAEREQLIQNLEDYAHANDLLTPELLIFIDSAKSKAKEESALLKKNPNLALKKNCVFADRNKTLPPPKDQGDSGICYAFAAADLLTYKLKKEVSCADVSLNYGLKLYEEGKSPEKFDLVTGGSPAVALETMKDMGICLEKNFKSESTKKYSLHDLKERAFDEAAQEILRSDDDLRCNSYLNLYSQFFPNLSFKDFSDIIAFARADEILERLDQVSCSKREPTGDIEVIRKEYYESEKDLISNIQNSLNHDHPLVINVKLNKWLKGNPQKYIGHAMVVADQRWNEKTQTCQFLVRNYWGNETNLFQENDITPNDDGTLWVNKDLLESTVLETASLK